MTRAPTLQLTLLARLLSALLVTFSVVPLAAEVPMSIEDLRTRGAFGFPAQAAATLADTDNLRVQSCNDDQYLVVQAIVWRDGDDTLGETSDGRPIGDNSHLVVDADFNRSRTPMRDRSYMLNPWPTKPGLHYSVPLGRNASSYIKTDSEGRGAIRYVSVEGQRKIRVDTFAIPLSELEVKPGATIGLALLASSASPHAVVYSADQEQGKRVRYARDLAFKTFAAYTLASDGRKISIDQFPKGRQDRIPLVKPEIQPLLKLGQMPPKMQVESWLNTDEKLSWEQLSGKVVLVDFWATWCGPCVAGIPHLNELYQAHHDDGLEILGITDQSRQGIERFQKRVKMNYPVGVGSEMAAAFGARALPHAFIFGRDGKLCWEGNPRDQQFDGALARALDETVVEARKSNGE